MAACVAQSLASIERHIHATPAEEEETVGYLLQAHTLATSKLNLYRQGLTNTDLLDVRGQGRGSGGGGNGEEGQGGEGGEEGNCISEGRAIGEEGGSGGGERRDLSGECAAGREM